MVAELHEITHRLVWLARTPGCGPMCGDRFGHHAETHEQYGAAQERLQALSSKVVTTGVLAIDLERWTVVVDGRLVTVQGRQWQLLALLARHVGSCVRYERIIREIWGAEWLETPAHALHNVSITRLRLRSVLGAAATLVVTRAGMGMQLLDVPAGGDASAAALETLQHGPPPAQAERTFKRVCANGFWSRLYDRCRRCQRNDRPHDSYGLCQACHGAWRRAKAAGRELAPIPGVPFTGLAR